MKRSTYTSILALVLVAFPFAVRADDTHQNMVMEHGQQVMPFDQSQAMHMFLPSETGGVIEIVVHDLNPTQIALVRAHLFKRQRSLPRATTLTPRIFTERACLVSFS
jgi:hypothetical protein